MEQNFNILTDRLSDFNKDVMTQVITYFDGLEDHELVVGGWSGNGKGLSNSAYLRHNTPGKSRGKGIYFNSYHGSVLEVSARERKFFFGDRVQTDEVSEMLDYFKNLLS